jgi:hypothetical protein
VPGDREGVAGQRSGKTKRRERAYLSSRSSAGSAHLLRKRDSFVPALTISFPTLAVSRQSQPGTLLALISSIDGNASGYRVTISHRCPWDQPDAAWTPVDALDRATRSDQD